MRRFNVSFLHRSHRVGEEAKAVVTSPQISILMPVRDGERYLTQALESLYWQSFQNFELIVVDDGSADGTIDILSQHAARDARLRVLRRDREGLVPALNAGLSACRAPYIARMDADDMALPERLQKQFAFLKANPKVIVVGGQSLIIGPEGREVRIGHYPVGPESCRAHLRRASPFCHPAVMFRAAPVHRIGGYRAAYQHAEDLDLWLRLEELGDLDNLPDLVIHYRRHSASVTVNHAEEQACAAALAQASAALRRCGAPDPTPVAGWVSTSWPAIRSFFSSQDVVEILDRAYYTALALNGGILSNQGWHTLYSKALTQWTNTDSDWAFVLSRGAAQLWRHGQIMRALKLLCVGFFTVGGATANKLLALDLDGANP